jgi:hypothetical protein
MKTIICKRAILITPPVMLYSLNFIKASEISGHQKHSDTKTRKKNEKEDRLESMVNDL